MAAFTPPLADGVGAAASWQGPVSGRHQGPEKAAVNGRDASLPRNISASAVSNANGAVCLTGETHAEAFGPVFDTVDVHGSAAGGSRYHAGPRGDDQQQAHQEEQGEGRAPGTQGQRSQCQPVRLQLRRRY